MALDLLTRAVALDNDFAPAIALMAEVHVYRHANGWANETSGIAAEAVGLARRAILADWMMRMCSGAAPMHSAFSARTSPQPWP